MSDIEQARAIAVAVTRQEHAGSVWLEGWCHSCTIGDYDTDNEVRTALAGIRLGRGASIQEAIA